MFLLHYALCRGGELFDGRLVREKQFGAQSGGRSAGGRQWAPGRRKRLADIFRIYSCTPSEPLKISSFLFRYLSLRRL